MVGDHPIAHIVRARCRRPSGSGRTTGAVSTGRALGHHVDHRAHQVDLVNVVHALQQAGDALYAHAGIDVLARQRAEDLKLLLGSALAALVLHEHEVPDLDIAVLIGFRATLDAVFGAAVVVDLRAWPARPRDAHRPVVVGHAAALNALSRQPGHLLPQCDSFIVVVKHGGPKTFGIKTVAARRHRVGQQRPGQFDGPALEVIAEGEVARHLKEGVVPGGDSNFVDIRGADALLDAHRSVERRCALAQEEGHELHHAGVDEQQVGIVEDHRGTGHLGVTGADEMIQEPLPDLMGLHGCPWVPGVDAPGRLAS